MQCDTFFHILKVGQDPSLEGTGTGQNVLHPLAHALDTAHEGPGVAWDGDAVLLQGGLDVADPAQPTSIYLLGTGDNGHDLDAHLLPSWKTLGVGHIGGGGDPVV